MEQLTEIRRVFVDANGARQFVGKVFAPEPMGADGTWVAKCECDRVMSNRKSIAGNSPEQALQLAVDLIVQLLQNNGIQRHDIHIEMLRMNGTP